MNFTTRHVKAIETSGVNLHTDRRNLPLFRPLVTSLQQVKRNETSRRHYFKHVTITYQLLKDSTFTHVIFALVSH